MPDQPDASSRERALESLLVEHTERLTAFVALRMGAALRARESVHDVVQSICGEVLARAPEFEFRGVPEFRAWMFRIAANRIATKGRYHQRERRDPAREVHLSPTSDERLLTQYGSICSPSRFLATEEALRQFEEAFARLPEPYRIAISMRYLAQADYETVAAELDRSVPATRMLVSRGLAALAKDLDPADS